MEDDDTIAVIYPALGDGSEKARESIDFIENKLGYVKPKCVAPQSLLVVSVDHRIRESTVEPDKHDSLEYQVGYRLSFKDSPKTSFGVVAGRSPKSDFVLAEVDGVSWHHFAFQFDNKYRLIVKDLHSTCGTSVKYNSRDEGSRVGGTWIIGGCAFLEDIQEIVIQVTDLLQFRVKVPVRDINLAEYREKVDRFRQGTAGAEDLLRELSFKTRQATRQSSKVPTPSKLTSPIIFTREVGQGSFAKVSHYWNASTGEEYVLKVPEGRYMEEAWRREASIMRLTSHVSP